MSELDQIIQRAHFLNLNDVALFRTETGSTSFSIEKIDSFSREERFISVKGMLFKRSPFVRANDVWWQVQPLTDNLTNRLLPAAKQIYYESLCGVEEMLKQAKIDYPDCKAIFDPHGFDELVYILSIGPSSLLVKIGKTKAGLKQRIKSLQTGNPFQITPLLVTNKIAERYLHNELKDIRISGSEWFDLELMLEQDAYRLDISIIEDLIESF